MRIKRNLSLIMILTVILALGVSNSAQAYHARWDDRNPTQVDGPKDPPPDKEPNNGQGGDPVDLYTGNFSYEHTDFQVAGRGLPFIWQRHYNSQSDYIYGPFGPGWNFYYNIALTCYTDSYVQISFGDRTKYIFTLKDGVYQNPPEFQGRLEKRGDNEYRLYEKTGVYYTFKLIGSSIFPTSFNMARAENKLASANGGMVISRACTYGYRVSEIVDRNGNKMTFAYTSRGRLDSIMDPAGRKYGLTYNNSGTLASLTDPAGQVYRYHYDPQGRLAEYVEPNGAVTRYTYQPAFYIDPIHSTVFMASASARAKSNSLKSDAASTPRLASAAMAAATSHPYTSALLTGITDPKGNTYMTNQYDINQQVSAQGYNGGTFNFTYERKESNGNRTVTVKNRSGVASTYYLDAKGRPLSVTNYLGEKVQLTYDTAGNITQVINPNDDKTLFTYDAKENCTQVTDALNQTVKMEYNEYGQVTFLTDQSGNKTEYKYDDKGNLIEVKNALGISNTFVYNDQGEMIEAKDPYNNSTKFEYDGNGYLKKVTDALGNVTQYTYDILGRLLGTTDAKGNKTSYEYGYNGINKVTDAKGNVTQYSYDLNGKLETITDPLNNVIRTSYDQWKRLTSITDPLGNITTYVYNVEDKLSETIDANDNKVKYEYDGLNRVSKLIDANNKETLYSYDKCGNIAKLQNAKGNNYALEYDKLNRLTKITDPLNRVTSYTYFPTSLTKSVTNPDGSTVQNEYDVTNRLTKFIYPDQSFKTYTYDNNSLVLSINQGTNSLQFAYNVLGQLTKATDVFGREVSYTYDTVGNCTQMTAPGQKVFSYGFDELNRPISLVSPSGTFGFEYDGRGRRTKLIYPNGKTATYSYDQLDRITNLNNGIQNYTYTYDKTLNIRSINGPNGLNTYDFDNSDRLTEAVYADGTKETYTYDEIGNRLSKTTTNGKITDTINYVYNAANQLTSTGNTKYTYDLRGRLTQKTDGQNVTQYQYTQQNLLQSVLDGNNQEIVRYTYDPSGRRVTSRDNNQVIKHLWDNHAILGDYSESGELQTLYTMGEGIDEVLAINKGSSNHFVHADQLGSITEVTDSDGNKTWGRVYDAFGQIKTSTGSPTTNLGFTGRDFNSNTGLIYLRTRFYDPQLGRFISEDSAQYGDNWYNYAGNNPLLFADPYGENPLLLGLLIPMLGGVVYQAAVMQNPIDGKEFATDFSTGFLMTYDGMQVAGAGYGIYRNSKPSKGASGESKIPVPQKGYTPQPGERTLDGYVKNSVPIDAETGLNTKSPGFNNNPQTGTGGQFKRFGSDSHADLSPHVHQPQRNVNPNNGSIYGTTGSKTGNGGVTSPTEKDVKQLYDYLNNGKYK